MLENKNFNDTNKIETTQITNILQELFTSHIIIDFTLHLCITIHSP